MDEFEAIVDGIEQAKNLQWEIAAIEDPVEASLRSREALIMLDRLRDVRFETLAPIIVKSLSSFVLKVWMENQGRHVSWQFDGMIVEGSSLGVGVVQNLGEPALQTLFLGVKNPKIVNADNDQDRDLAEHLPTPHIIIPILDIEEATFTGV